MDNSTARLPSRLSRDDLVAARDGERAARHAVVLDVHEEEGVRDGSLVGRGDLVRPPRARSGGRPGDVAWARDVDRREDPRRRPLLP